VETLLEALASKALIEGPEPDVDARLETLLADFLACVFAGRRQPDADAFLPDGTIGKACLLALRSSAQDRDDVDWSTLHHPGSVVWPVVVALASEIGVTGDLLGRAARAGYATIATVADLLGPTHRVSWHVTATAGAVGAASAASVLLGLSPGSHVRALALAVANAGGLASAARERRGAAGFNRAAAVTLGISAARAASVGSVAVASPLSSPGGLVELTSQRGLANEVPIRDGIRDAAIRIYPVCGFLQSAVSSVALLRSQVDGELRSLRIGVPEGARQLLSGDAGGPWWDGRLSALRTWAGASPFMASAPCELDDRKHLVHIVAADLPPGSSDVFVITDRGEGSIDAADPPTLSDAQVHANLREKWTGLLGRGGPSVEELSQGVLTGMLSVGVLEDTWA
jgi:2-methylcitrate dehydratase PrpD